MLITLKSNHHEPCPDAQINKINKPKVDYQKCDPKNTNSLESELPVYTQLDDLFYILLYLLSFTYIAPFLYKSAAINSCTIVINVKKLSNTL